jgi:hypothetical protein
MVKDFYVKGYGTIKEEGSSPSFRHVCNVSEESGQIKGMK